ncbi:MAG: WYL domain-containing transcriptional regulator [Planctomycetes bacterium]|nr:WYL domain-containing transcriptional regulator [Planctomycetota bacterium]
MKLSRISRIVQLLCTLQSGQCYSPDELVKVMQVSRRTVFRDLQELTAIGVPYYFDSDAGGYRIDPDFFLPSIDLTLQEALSLLMLIYKDRGHLPPLLKRSALLAGLKVENNLPAEIKRYCAATLEHISIQPIPRSVGGAIGGDKGDSADRIFWHLQRSVERKQKVRIVYRSIFDSATIKTTLSPHHLMFKSRAWYIVGKSSLHNEIRTFKLSRIETLQVLSQFFPRKKTFDIEDYLSSAWSMIPEGKLYNVKLKFTPRVARNVSEVQWHKSQKMQFEEDGSLVVEFRVDGIGEIGWWVLGYGDQVEVLAPKALRKRVAGVGAKMAKINS